MPLKQGYIAKTDFFRVFETHRAKTVFQKFKKISLNEIGI